jgi:hypothetical protein
MEVDKWKKENWKKWSLSLNGSWNKKNIHVIDILFDNSSEWYKKWVKLKLSKKVQMR